MDFSLTKQQDSICRAIREMAVSRLNNSVFQDDEKGTFRHDNWAQLGKTGLCGLPIPEAYGGQNLDMLTTALAIEALAASCHDEGLVFSLCAHLCTCAVPIWKHGTQWQKEAFLTGLSTGRLVGGNGMTEESAGSDVSGIKTIVEKKGMGYTLSGSKLFVTNGPVADALVIYASHGDGMAMANISAFIIDKET